MARARHGHGKPGGQTVRYVTAVALSPVREDPPPARMTFSRPLRERLGQVVRCPLDQLVGQRNLVPLAIGTERRAPDFAGMAVRGGGLWPVAASA